MQTAGEDPLIGKIIGRRYEVVERLAQGGSASVYIARQRPLGRRVAVKVIRTDLSDEQRGLVEARFLREANLASRLSHPNVVTYLDAGVTRSGLRYVVTELLQGRSLRMALADGPVDPHWAAVVAAHLARGLHHAHRQGLVHRDLKPGNVILVPEDDGAERPVIIDFGIVKDTEADEETTEPGLMLGTPRYMAPEQARGDAEVGPPADAYALGCLLFRMLAGVAPFKGPNDREMSRRHLDGTLPAIRERNPDVQVPAELEAVVIACTDPDPSARPQLDAVAHWLDTWVTQGPAVAAVSPPVPVPASRRWPAYLGGGVAVVALAVGGLWRTSSPVQGVAPEPLVSAVLAPVTVEAPLVLDAPPVASEPPPVADAVDDQPEVLAEVATPPTVAAPAPSSAPSPRPAPPRAAPPVTIDGLTLTAAHARRMLGLVNDASARELGDAGVYGDGVKVITRLRPFTSLEDLAGRRGIGPSTLRALAAATADDPSAFLVAPEVKAVEGGVDVEGVVFTDAQAERVLTVINEASVAELLAAGVYERGVEAIVAHRPFASLQAFAATPLIGSKTLQVLRDATR